MTSEKDAVRMKAMTAFLLDRVREGYVVESNTDTQAVIQPASRWTRINPFAKPSGRHVVSVDADGNVSMTPIEPRRW